MSRTAPRFSVVIAVYNGAQTLARAIGSVLEQSWPVHELIVVDDGSTDGSAAVAQGFGERVRYLRQPNRGVSAARNRGVEVATGDWVAFLDADDWYYPDRIAHHARWIDRDPALDFLTGDFEYRAEDGALLGRSLERTAAGRALLGQAAGAREAVMEGDLLGFFVEQHFGDTHTLSLPRATFLALGGYPSGVAVCEDVNLLVRLTARSRRVGVVCEPLAVYTIHPRSATRSDPLRAQRQTVEALLPLRAALGGAAPAVRRGLEGAIRRARLDYASALLRVGERRAAVGAVLPGLWERPGLGALRDLVSVARG